MALPTKLIVCRNHAHAASLFGQAAREAIAGPVPVRVMLAQMRLEFPDRAEEYASDVDWRRLIGRSDITSYDALAPLPPPLRARLELRVGTAV